MASDFERRIEDLHAAFELADSYDERIEALRVENAELRHGQNVDAEAIKLWLRGVRIATARAEAAEAEARSLREQLEKREREVRRMRLECHRIGGDESWGAESAAVGATMRLMAARVLDAGDVGKGDSA